MAASATGSVKITVTGELKNTLTDTQVVTTTVGTNPSINLTSGTGALMFNRGWQSKNRALVSAATLSVDMYDLGALDLGTGAGEDALGLALACSAVVCLCVENLSTSAGTLLVGGEGSAAAWNSIFNGVDTAKLSLPPNSGVCIWAVGATAFPVADTSNHLLKFEASGGDCSYNITVLCRA